MAGNYTITKKLDEPLVLSASQVEDGTTVGFVTHPHEIYCEATLPKSQVDAIGVAFVAEPLAFNIERILNDGLASGAYFAQAVDDSGLLAGTMVFTVTVPGTDMFAGGTLSENVTLTIPQLYTLSDYLGEFDAAKQRLQDAAGL